MSNKKTKVIIDSAAAIAHYNNTHTGGHKMNQKELCDITSISEQKIINWKQTAPKVAADILSIQKLTGAPLDVIIKEIEV